MSAHVIPDAQGHPIPDPNAGVVRADPPGRVAWLAGAVSAALALAVLLAVAFAVARA